MAVSPQVPDELNMTWLQATQTGQLLFPNVGNPILFSRSTNGGKTWSKPVQVNRPSRVRVVAPSVAVGANGRLLISYLDMGNDALDYNGGSGGMGGPAYPGPWTLVLAYSNDSGIHWGETVVAPKVVPYTRFVVFLPPVPSLVVNTADNHVYVGFTDAVSGDPDAYVWTSANNGASFGAGVLVNDTPKHHGTAQYLPRLAVAPDGRLDVLYYDRRTDPSDLLNAVSLQSSYDGGRTFSHHLVVSDRSFSSQSGKQDIGSQVISITARSGWRTPLEALGWVLEALGLAALVVATLAWHAGRRPELEVTADPVES
ncbi:MAG: sialidase family protein [Acidimicrobiales bacterium]